ncbi:MAG: helix-turn-helix transcriptional regulator [Clostridia bacterium]|nr:helix-turn-helix transcriptional regulator [Clostridia bacterium]
MTISTIIKISRLNKIIAEQNISKREFAKRIGVSENYVYTLTGESKKITTLSSSLAKVIAMEFGYDAEWILHGDKDPKRT